MHATRSSMNALFSDYIDSPNGNVPWPLHSPVLTARDLFFYGRRGFFKSKVYEANPPNTIQALERLISDEIEAIPVNVLREVVQYFQFRIK